MPRGDQRLPVNYRGQSIAIFDTKPHNRLLRRPMCGGRISGIGRPHAHLASAAWRDGGPYREPAGYGMCPDPAWVATA